MNHRKAFTLIEMLVSISIIALLIGILIPALGSVRAQSRELVSAVNLRSIGHVFEVYIADSKGLFPAPVPGEFYPSPDPRILMTMGHWQASNIWHGLFYKTHPWTEYEQMYLAPGAQRDIGDGTVVRTIFSSFQYSSSFLGQPEIWNGQGEGLLDLKWPQLERSVRKSMVRYPSAKALMWDVEMPYLRRPLERDEYFNLLEKTPILFADQHVESHIPAEANPGVTNWAPSAAHRQSFLHNTKDGVFGRDY